MEDESMSELKESSNEIDFDFDAWMALYKKDPESFEKQKKDLVQEVINQAPEKMQRRLNGLQWQIDTEVKLAKNSLDGCIKVYQMMMDSVYEPGGLLEALSMTEERIKEDLPNVVKINNFSRVNKDKVED